MDDGYWTPWHAAAGRIEALEAENAKLREGSDFYAGKYADRCGDVFKLEAQLAASDAAQERARIVAWLRGMLLDWDRGAFYEEVAEDIERGDHLAVPAQEAMEGEG